MFNADLFVSRPTLVNPSTLSAALDGLRAKAASEAQLWQLLTQSYTVDLDAVAKLMPAQDPEPVWLAARG